MTYLDNRGLFDDSRRPRTPQPQPSARMSDTLHEIEEMLIRQGRLRPPADRDVKRPPGFPSALWPAWPIPLYQWRLRRYVARWYAPDQPVRIICDAFKGRAGVITGLHPHGPFDWAVVVKLYGGVVGQVDYATNVGMHGVIWLSPREAEQARQEDREMVNRARMARTAATLDLATLSDLPHTFAESERDGILHPHRRLQV